MITLSGFQPRAKRARKKSLYTVQKTAKCIGKLRFFTEFWDPRFWPEIKPPKTFGDFLARNKTAKQTFGCLDLKGGLKATPRYLFTMNCFRLHYLLPVSPIECVIGNHQLFTLVQRQSIASKHNG